MQIPQINYSKEDAATGGSVSPSHPGSLGRLGAPGKVRAALRARTRAAPLLTGIREGSATRWRDAELVYLREYITGTRMVQLFPSILVSVLEATFASFRANR